MFEQDYISKLQRFGQYAGRAASADGSVSAATRSGKLADKALDVVVAGVVGSAASGLSLGAMAGPAAIGAFTGGAGTKIRNALYSGRVARRSFEGGAPQVRETAPDMGRGRIGVGAGLYAGSGAE